MSNDCCNEEPEKIEEKETVIYAAKAPYPPIRASERNPQYGRMMLDNMGGSNSEMSAVSLYIYNQMITGSLKEVSYAFHKISIVEMHHIHIFGELALNLGENPRLWTHRGNQMYYWTPGYNHYPTELAPLLKNAIQGEENAILKYQQQARQIKDPCITDILERIIEDEKIHIQIYKKLQKEAGIY